VIPGHVVGAVRFEVQDGCAVVDVDAADDEDVPLPPDEPDQGEPDGIRSGRGIRGEHADLGRGCRGRLRRPVPSRPYPKQPLPTFALSVEIGQDEEVGEPLDAVEGSGAFGEHLDAALNLAGVFRPRHT